MPELQSSSRKAGTIQGIIIIFIFMMPMMAIVALMPVVPAIAEHFKEIPNIMTWAPLVLSAPGLCIALVSPYAGFLIDRFGRRRILLWTLFLYGIGGILPFFLNSFPALFGGRLVLGIGEAFVMTIGNVLLGDYYSGDQRSKWLMIQGIVAPAFGTSLLSISGRLAAISWQYPFLLYGLAFLIAIAAWIFLFEPERKVIAAVDRTEVKIPFKPIIRLCLITLALASIYFVYTLQFSLALDEMGIKDRAMIGDISAVASIAVPVGSIIFKLFARRSVAFQLLVIAIFIGIGLTGIGLATNKYSVMAFAFIQQLGCGMTIPVLIAWGLNSLPAEFRGRGMGFWSSAFFLGQFISPLIVSSVRQVAGTLLHTFAVFGIICFLLGLANYFFSKKEEPAMVSG